MSSRPDDLDTSATRAALIAYLDRLARLAEYREAQMMERCVVYAPPRTPAEARQRRLDRERVEGFLALCAADWTSRP